MGHQPGLDGLRGVSVLAVIAYHAGFGGLHGGFLGVEVFFVVSGYLITTLLLEEHERSAGVSLRSFWVRRARRLLPALFLVLAVTSVWVLLWGSPEQASQMRRDLPWAVGYLANWGQVVGDVPEGEPRRGRRAPVPAQVGDDEPAPPAEALAHAVPQAPVTEQAVAEQQRWALPFDVVGDRRAGDLDGLHALGSFGARFSLNTSTARLSESSSSHSDAFLR